MSDETLGGRIAAGKGSRGRKVILTSNWESFPYPQLIIFFFPFIPLLNFLVFFRSTRRKRPEVATSNVCFQLISFRLMLFVNSLYLLFAAKKLLSFAVWINYYSRNYSSFSLDLFKYWNAKSGWESASDPSNGSLWCETCEPRAKTEALSAKKLCCHKSFATKREAEMNTLIT